MTPRMYRAYTLCGYVHCFVHASSNFYNVYRLAKVAGAYIQISDDFGKTYGRGKHVDTLSSPWR